jgi:hypothetical protein
VITTRHGGEDPRNAFSIVIEKVRTRQPRGSGGPGDGWRGGVEGEAACGWAVVSISVGKDSQAALHRTILATAAGVASRVTTVFADLGTDDEWPGTRDLAADHPASGTCIRVTGAAWVRYGRAQCAASASDGPRSMRVALSSVLGGSSDGLAGQVDRQGTAALLSA